MRRSAILAAVAAIFAALAAGASAAPLVWVVNNDKDDVATIDAATGTIVGTPIAVGERPESIAITPDGRFAFVTSYGADEITVIDTTTRAVVATIPLPAHAKKVAISPDGKIAYATVESSPKVSVIDTATDQIIGTVSTAEEASAIAFAPNGKFAYISSGEESVEAIETATGKAIGPPIHVGKFPEDIVFTPNGSTAYVSGGVSKTITVINVALGQAVGTIPFPDEPAGLAVSPNGSRLYVADEQAGTTSVYETEGDRPVGKPIVTGAESKYIAITPDGTTAYVSVPGEEAVTPIDLATDVASKPIAFVGETAGLAVTPDQSPTAAFAAPSPVAGLPTAFSGAGSTDPDGAVAAFNWTFGDGVTATGVSVPHTYAAPGTYAAKLSVVDEAGCGEAEVFTGQTAYCSGNPAATVTHPVTVTAPPILCTSRFGFRGLVHNRRNGTVRLRVKLPAAGSLLLFGKKVHAVTRKIRKPGTMMLTVHPRVELNKQLKRIHRAGVRIRITFWPAAGCASTTIHRSFALLRAPKKTRRGR